MHTVICEVILLYTVANGCMHALMAQRQRMPVARKDKEYPGQNN